MFEVIPAIDVIDGRLAVFGPDGPRRSDAFGGDPVAAATAALDAGTRRLHVVDLNLAFEGRAANLQVVAAIARLGVPVQAAGGVGTAAEVGAMLEAGASRVVLGSSALARPDLARALLAEHAARLIVGIEAAGDRIRSRGRTAVDLDLMETLGWVVAAGAHVLLVTSVDRVGGLGGPDVRLARRVVRTGCPVLVAGGVSSIEDLHAVRAVGAAGAIVGRAALEGTLDLEDAIAAMG